MEQIGCDREEILVMDKPKNSRTITIKINGNERDYNETSKMDEMEPNLVNEIVEPQPETQPHPKASTRVDSFSEVAASQEAIDESFDWILPEVQDDDEIDEYIIAKKPQVNKKKSSIGSLKKTLQKQNKGPVKSLFVSILLAILIGTSFGFIVLKLVISDSQMKVETPLATVPEETAKGNEQSAGETQQLALEPIDTYIIQGGVFSSVDSAKVEEQKVKEMGIPTQIIESNGQAILVLGVADSIENAKSIATGYKDKGIDVFAKPYSLPGKEVEELTAVEANLLKESKDFYNALASLMASGMFSEQLDKAAITELKNFVGSIDRQEIKNLKIEQLLVDLGSALTKLEAFSGNPTQSTLVDVQQHLLSFIGTYYTL
jgi:stage II sporulation protein B